jgi:hypothetical protein
MSEYIAKKTGVKMNKNFIQTDLQVHRKGNKFVDHAHITKLYNDYKKALPQGSLIVIRVMTPDAIPKTITKEGKLNLKELDDYLDGRVRDSTKFYDISQLLITIQTPKKNKTK